MFRNCLQFNLASIRRMSNRLANEKSPYLLQHKNNPVDWYPWSNEAFAKAQELNRPIFLSIGYSTCHWCHVMEHESFESQSIAKYLNEHFVSVKVDREERPDVDRYYMSFVQAMSGSGGWPLSVFLTPDKHPFLGGTYFPPNDTPYQSGFLSVLKLVTEKWNEDPNDIKEHAEYLTKILKEAYKSKKFEGQIVAKESISECFKALKTRFDEENGGFSISPKFPEPSNLVFLAQYCVLHKKDESAKEAEKMLLHTLNKMASGGIHDFIGGGFHRYSVDKLWHVPHFEKMLYDQAQLLAVYSQAQMFGHDYQLIIEGIVSYVKECLTSKDGGFYSAEDADSLPTAESPKKIEGSFYVWTKDEIDQILQNFASADNENITLNELFCDTYNIGQNGNVSKRVDAHGELTGKNVLLRTEELADLAKKFKMTTPQFQNALHACYEELKKYRDKRPRPHLDNKILTSWNSMMISGLIYAARALPKHESEYMNLADKAFEFIVRHLRKNDGSLIRSAYVDSEGNYAKVETTIDAYADDYANFIRACIDLYEVKFEDRYLQLALDTQKIFNEKFFDNAQQSGYFYTSSDTKETFERSKPEQDGAEPSSNSVAALNLIRLAELFDNKEYENIATKIINGAGSLLTKNPHAMPLMITALENLQTSSVQIIVCGNECKEMLKLIKSKFIPNGIVIYISSLDGLICSKNKHVKEMASSFKKATAMVCSDFHCSLPSESVQELQDRLNEVLNA